MLIKIIHVLKCIDELNGELLQAVELILCSGKHFKNKLNLFYEMCEVLPRRVKS